jgi:hypothetical protein
MPGEIPDYEPLMREAVAAFWGIRDRQATAQRVRGTVDAGTRGSVTGGQHMGPIDALLTRVLQDAGAPTSWAIHTGQRARIPGYYRESKNLDMVVTAGDAVVAAIEAKSQVGSFGNNLNNRIEEAIGQSVDFWKSHDVEFIPGGRPWFGYVMIVESSPVSTRPVRSRQSLFPPDGVFSGMSYVERYAMTFERLYQERLVDAVAYAVSPKNTDFIDYPSVSLSFQHFATLLHNRVREVRSLGL